jgi:hypothetical protein
LWKAELLQGDQDASRRRTNANIISFNNDLRGPVSIRELLWNISLRGVSWVTHQLQELSNGPTDGSNSYSAPPSLWISEKRILCCH